MPPRPTCHGRGALRCPGELPRIVSTVLSMVMSPIGLEKANFMVAEEDGERLGFGQLRALEAGI